VPPLMVLVGRELAAAGQIGRGISLLKGILRDVSDGDLDVLAHRDRALASLILRMRLLEQDERIPTSLSESRNPEDRAFAWAASARRGDRAQTPVKVPPFVSGNVDRAAWLHAIWQAMPALNVDSARDAFAWAEGNLEHDVPGDSAIAAFYRTALALDRREALFVGQEWHDQRTTLEDGSFSADDYWQRYPLEPQRTLALALREAALISGPFDERARAMRESAERLGFRCAATIALDLGD